MNDPGNESALKAAVALLSHYSFDQAGVSSDQLLDRWLRRFPPRWVRLALIEALYLGRYKAISVEQILILWLRRGQPSYHFNNEFERLVCYNLPKNLLLTAPKSSTAAPQETEVELLSWEGKTTEIPGEGTEGTNNSPAQSVETSQLSAGTNLKFQSLSQSPIPQGESTLLQSTVHKPIHEFQPNPGPSEFYTKLTTIARNWKESREEILPKNPK